MEYLEKITLILLYNAEIRDEKYTKTLNYLE